MRASRPLATAAAAALALLAGACGSSGTSTGNSAIQPAPSADQTSSAPTASTPTATTPTPAPPVPAAIAKKPTIAKPTGPAPKTLVVHDLVKGTGPAVKAGQMLTVQYVGVLYSNAKQFDTSWGSGSPFTFTLGTGGVIPGWDQGIPGMHVGGRRQLIIPAALGYGALGSPPKIPPNAPLIFDVDLLAAK